MSFTNAFLTDDFHLDLLARSHLCDKYVVQQRFGLGNAKFLVPSFLVTNWDPLEITRVDIRVVEENFLITSVVQDYGSVLVFLGAFNVQFESEAVMLVIWLVLVFELEHSWVNCKGNQAHSVCQVLVRDDRCILPHLDFLNCDRWDLRDHDPPECVCKGWLCANEVEDNLFVVKLLDFDI